VHVCTDEAILEAAIAVIEKFGYRGLTLARLAEVAGSSRMTLHRREITIRAVTAGLSLKATAELRDGLFPVMSDTGPAHKRLEAAIRVMCDVADRHLPLLAGLFSDDEGIFHAEPDSTGSLPTQDVFVAPFAKLLADGAVDGTLLAQSDTTEAATVLFNTAGWGYVQLRHAQRWPAERAREGVLRLVMNGLYGPAAGGDAVTKSGQKSGLSR
jgi:AcrR family transcriptional regulator